MTEATSRYQLIGDVIGPYQLAKDTTLGSPVLIHRLPGAANDPLIAARLRVLGGRRHHGALTLLEGIATGNDLLIVYDAPQTLKPLHPPFHYRVVLDKITAPLAALAACHRDGLAVGQLGPHAVLCGNDDSWLLVPPVQDAASEDLCEIGILLVWLLANRLLKADSVDTDWHDKLVDGRPLPQNLEQLINDLRDPSAPSRPPGLDELEHRLRSASRMAGANPISATVQLSNDFSRELNREFPELPATKPSSGLSWGWLFLAIVCGIVAILIIFQRPETTAPTIPVESIEGIDPSDQSSLSPLEPAIAPELPPPVPEVQPPPTPPKPDPAAIAAMQAAFEAMLSARAEAESVGAPFWAPKRWQDLLATIRIGDEAKAASDFAAATEAWQGAADSAKAIYESRLEAMTGLLEKGKAAMAIGDQAAAVQAYQTALAIDPADTAAANGLRRARVLTKVLGALAKAAELEAKGAFAGARLAYTEARKLDPQVAGAAAAISRLDATIAEEAFGAFIAEARRQLAENQLEEAKVTVTKARNLIPNHPDAARLEAAISRKLQQRAAREKFAFGSAAESREDWQAANREYQAAATLDPTLTDALAAARRVQQRHELDTRIKQLLSKPDTLLIPENRRNAALLVAEAKTLPATAVPELAATADKLELALSELTAPIGVKLASDGNTSVSILKFRRLGSFTALTLDLPPGNYVATGFRDGYQDVRVPFTIKPGSEPPVIEVVCTVRF